MGPEQPRPQWLWVHDSHVLITLSKEVDIPSTPFNPHSKVGKGLKEGTSLWPMEEMKRQESGVVGTPRAESIEDCHGLGSSEASHRSSISSNLSPTVFIYMFTVRQGPFVTHGPSLQLQLPSPGNWGVQPGWGHSSAPRLHTLRSGSPPWKYNCIPHQFVVVVLLFSVVFCSLFGMWPPISQVCRPQDGSQSLH